MKSDTKLLEMALEHAILALALVRSAEADEHNGYIRDAIREAEELECVIELAISKLARTA